MVADNIPKGVSRMEVIDTETLPEHVVRLFGKDALKEVEKEEGATDEKIKDEKVCAAASARIRELMKADNFSVLVGAGSSIPLGGKSFAKEYLEDGKWVAEGVANELKEDYKFLRDLHREKNQGIQYGVEEFLTFLYRLKHAKEAGFELHRPDGATLRIAELLKCILKNLMEGCSLSKKDGDYDPHKTFLKRIISRPTNLRRTNLFTTNYDLVFETAMDEMGIVYVDGFVGGLKSFFRPEAFNYDYYFPGGTTEGKVSRMERVLHYYKLHGSLSWVESKENSLMNVHGIQKKSGSLESDDVVLIYPTPMKEQDAIGFPYTEMFRRFANAIQQPQSVLVTYGYSFGDAHINRIICEALSVPSFQLVIGSYGWTPPIKYLYERSKEQPCIGFIIGEKYANWDTFVTRVIPDIPSVELEERYEKKQQVARAMKEQNLGITNAAEGKD